MLTLKEYSDIKDWLLQQPALSANLVGANGLMFQPKGDIQDRDILGRIGGHGLAFAGSHSLMPHEEGKGAGRQGHLAYITEDCRREGITTVCEIGSIVDIMHAPSLTNLKLLAPGCRGIRSQYRTVEHGSPQWVQACSVTNYGC